jgi:hypothetical protein
MTSPRLCQDNFWKSVIFLDFYHGLFQGNILSLPTKERSRNTTLLQKVHRVQNVKVENQTINKLKILSNDNGGEFTSKEFEFFLKI